jgi:hypothetical protein
MRCDRSKGHVRISVMPKFGRTQPPRTPPGPPASAKDGAAAVIKAAVKLFDRQDGNGVDKRLLAEILFHAAFQTLDQVAEEDRRKILAGRVHAGSYNRMVGNPEGDFSASKTGASPDADSGPSHAAEPNAPGPGASK